MTEIIIVSILAGLFVISSVIGFVVLLFVIAASRDKYRRGGS